MDINNVRISNIPRDSLGDLWKVVSSDDLNELILRSNEKEISILFGHLSENGIVETIRSIKDPSIAKIFSSLPFNLISKVLNLVDEKSTKRIISVLDRRLILKLMRGSNKQIKNKIMNSLPEERKSMLLEISGEDDVLDNEYKYYLSDKFENSIELDALNRIKKLEEREHYLEARQKSREEQYFS